MRPARPKPAGAELLVIPGVGPAMAADLRGLGVNRPADLRGQDPEELYLRLCALTGNRQDRCVLYVFRCAVYFASVTAPRPDLLKWWNWQDAASPEWEPHAPWSASAGA